MNCLHCGDCCRRMSPFSAPDPCPYIIEVQGLVFCRIYENRPQQCRDHRFLVSKCPIGVGVLGLKTHPQVQNVINKGREIIEGGLNHD